MLQASGGDASLKHGLIIEVLGGFNFVHLAFELHQAFELLIGATVDGACAIRLLE